MVALVSGTNDSHDDGNVLYCCKYRSFDSMRTADLRLS